MNLIKTRTQSVQLRTESAMDDLFWRQCPKSKPQGHQDIEIEQPYGITNVNDFFFHYANLICADLTWDQCQWLSICNWMRWSLTRIFSKWHSKVAAFLSVFLFPILVQTGRLISPNHFYSNLCKSHAQLTVFVDPIWINPLTTCEFWVGQICEEIVFVFELNSFF